MKSTIITLVIGSSVLLTTSSLRAEGTNATSQPSRPRTETPREAHLIAPGMAEKFAAMADLTEEQKEKIKAIEENFAKTYQEYQVAHQEEIQAARQAMETARQAMNKAMAGLQEQRQAAMEQIKALLTEEQRQKAQNQQGRTPAPRIDQK